MRLSHIIEATHHGRPNIEDPDGWVLSVSEADRHYLDDYVVDFWASDDLGNTVWEMENNPQRIKQTTLEKGLKEVSLHGAQYLYNSGLEQELGREQFQRLEYNFEEQYEKANEKFLNGIQGGHYYFFLVPESDNFSLLALK